MAGGVAEGRGERGEPGGLSCRAVQEQRERTRGGSSGREGVSRPQSPGQRDGAQRLLSQPVGGLSQHHTAPHTTGRLEE